MANVTLVISGFTAASVMNGTHVLSQLSDGVWVLDFGTPTRKMIWRNKEGWAITFGTGTEDKAWRVCLTFAELPEVTGKPVGNVALCSATNVVTKTTDDTGTLSVS